MPGAVAPFTPIWMPLLIAVVLNLGSIEPPGFDWACSRFRRRSSETWMKAWLCHSKFLLYWTKMGFDKNLENYVRFGVFVKVKNHWPIGWIFCKGDDTSSSTWHTNPNFMKNCVQYLVLSHSRWRKTWKYLDNFLLAYQIQRKTTKTRSRWAWNTK